jgi:hypothetical protein
MFSLRFSSKQGLLSPPLSGRGGERGSHKLDPCCSPLSLALSHKGRGDGLDARRWWTP